jgi:hypothetical protein
MNKFLALSIAAFISISATIAKDIQVNGYTKKDGTKVAGYTRHVSDKKIVETIAVKGYTKKNGTKVEGYTRRKAQTGQ